MADPGATDDIFVRLRHRAEALRAELTALGEGSGRPSSAVGGRASATDRPSWEGAVTESLAAIRQRKISSTVAVDSGDTIILGGLIQENRDLSESGVPGLHKVPVLGALFGNKADNQDRTELIVLITPRAVSNSKSALQVTDEYRRRLQKLIPGRSAQEVGGQSGTAGTLQTTTGF